MRMGWTYANFESVGWSSSLQLLKFLNEREQFHKTTKKLVMISVRNHTVYDSDESSTNFFFSSLSLFFFLLFLSPSSVLKYKNHQCVHNTTSERKTSTQPQKKTIVPLSLSRKFPEIYLVQQSIRSGHEFLFALLPFIF